MAVKKMMFIFLFWCALDSFCRAERWRENRKVVNASGKDSQVFSGRHEVSSLEVERRQPLSAVGHRTRRNSGIDSSNTTARPPRTERIVIPSTVHHLPAAPKPFNITCLEHFSCKGRCQQERAGSGTKVTDEDHHCYCDPYCNSFKDCCADFDQFCKGVVPTKKLEDKWRCHHGIMMIDSCPENFVSRDLIIKCANNSDELSASNYAYVTPVTSRSGKTYKNKYCALCNGVRKQDMKTLGYSFNCRLTPPQSYTTKQKLQFLIDYCFIAKLVTIGEQRVRKCPQVQTGDNCSPFRESEKIGCERGPYRVVFSRAVGVNFKNAHCVKCVEGISDEDITCGPISAKAFVDSTLNAKPFTAILNIDGKDEFHKSLNTVASCGDGQVYDVFLETCRKGFQFPMKKYSPKLDKYNIATWIQTGRNSRLSIQDYSNEVIFDSLSKFFGLKSQLFEFVERENVDESSMVVLVANLYIEKNTIKKARRESSPEISIDMLLNFARPFDISIFNDTFIIIKATSRLLTCVHVQYFTSEDYVVVHGSNNIYINETQELLTEKQYFANSTKMHNGYQIPVGLITVCRQHLPSTSPCNGTYISLGKDEYVMLTNNSVYRNVSNTVYNQGEYSIINASVFVCTEYSGKYTKTQPMDESQDDTVLRILTYIGLSLSVICLVIVLVTYLLFAELRTLPGVNLMNLSSALLVAHFFWLIGSGQTGSHGACVAIAVILHFSFLASFAWMSIIAFITWRAFSSTGCAGRSSDKEYRRKKTRCTLAVGWLPVLVLVLTCLAIDQLESVRIGYGGPKGCWINNGTANLVVFILPLAASVIWNAVFFGLTVKSIHKTKKQARMVTVQRESKRNFAIYIKIAVLMGFTWIFGFLALIKSTYFSYPFVLLNTLQGVYIAVAFTFNSRIKNLYHLKFTNPNNLSKSGESTNKYTKHSTDHTRV